MNSENPSENRNAVDHKLPPPLPEAPGRVGSDDFQQDHFQTDHLLTNLKGLTISSGVITMMSQGVQFVLTLASTMILARLLSPGDFGLLAMVFTILSCLRVFKEAGLSTATVQRENITHAQVSNLFWINVAVSGFFGVLVAAAAPLVAWFYREPRLVGITLALSVTFFLAGANVQHLALLNRQMRFKAIAVIQIGSLLAGILVGISMAWQKCDYWSLVGFNLTTGIVACLLTWSICRWRPKVFTLRSGTRPLLHFGANLTAGSFIFSMARGLDGLLIGRFFGATSAGLYSRAAALLSRPLEQLLYPIEAVFIPAFSRLQNQPDRYRHSFLHVYETVALVSFLLTGMCFSMAHALTLVVLGPKWEGAAVIFAGFTFAALQYPLTTTATWLFTSQGRGRDSFVAISIISIITAVSFIAGLPFGPAGVAIAYSTSCLFIQLPILYWLAGRHGPVSTADLWAGFLRHLPAWGVVAFTGFLVRLPIPDEQPFKELLLAVPCSLLAGVAFIFVYSPSRRVVVNLVLILRELRNPIESAEVGRGNVRADAANPSSDKVHFTVVIPTFNREQLLKRAIESALNQTVKADQIIVVDDGSTDATAEVCGKYTNSIEYIRQANTGVAGARNRGVRLARHDWIAFLDSDDYWTPTHLEKMTIAIKNTSGRAAFYFADIQHTSNEAHEMSLWSEIGFKFADLFLLTPDGTSWMLARCQPCSIQSSVFSTAVLRASGGFDQRFRVMEDTALFCRLGFSNPVCAVNSIGCIKTSDSDPNNRLTVAVHEYTESYCRHTCMLWSSLLFCFMDLDLSYRRVIRFNLANGYWRLGRNCFKSGRFHHATLAFVRCLKAHPYVFITFVLGRRLISSDKYAVPMNMPVYHPETQTAKIETLECEAQRSQ